MLQGLMTTSQREPPVVEGRLATRSSQSTCGHNLDGVYQWTAEST